MLATKVQIRKCHQNRYPHPLFVNILKQDLERVSIETFVNFLNISKSLILHLFVIKSVV